MYPITPATSVSHELAEFIENYGGMVHQAEDEIAAAGVAHRRLLRRQGRADGYLRSGHGAEDRVPGAGHHDRSAAGGPRRSARWSVDRPADQGRAVRPAVLDLRPARRCAAGGYRAAFHRGVLPFHGDGAPHCRDLPHRGDRADRRQPGDRRAAVHASRTGCPLAAGPDRPRTACPRACGPTTGIRKPACRGASFRARRAGSTRSPAWRTTKTAWFPITRPATNAACACAAASWRYSSRP